MAPPSDAEDGRESDGRAEAVVAVAASDDVEQLDPRRTYIDKRDGTRRPGCKHYSSRCEQKAKCCGKFFPCRLCHDDEVEQDSSVPTHEMNRFEVRVLRCTNCHREQDIEPGEEKYACKWCGVRFASYACTKCMLFHDGGDRDIYHCDLCKICRLGKREENTHCDQCGACISNRSTDMSSHSCTVNSVRGDCPVCMTPLHGSVKVVVYLSCGHAMHEDCFRELVQRDYRCCICLKSMADMSLFFRQIDRVVESDMQRMPPQFVGKEVDIMCNDCGGRSRVPFHFEFRKCRAVSNNGGECGSYNTRLVGRD